MKKCFFFITSLMLLVTVACDKNKDVAENVAKEFAQAINDKDLSEVNSLYPLLRKMKVSHLVDSLNYKKIKIEKQDSLYIAEYVPGGQLLYIKVNDDKSAEVTNSRSIVPLNENAAELAKLTGVPIKKINDYQLDNLFEPSLYLVYLYEQTANKNASALNISYNDINWVAGNIEGLTRNVKISVRLTNELNHEIKGNQYNLEITVNYGPGFAYSKLYVEPGVNLMPDENHVFVVTDQNLYNYFHKYNVVVTAEVLPKDQSDIGMLLFQGDFNGTEYSDFLKKYPNVNIDDPSTYIPKKTVNEEAATSAEGHVEEIKNFISSFYNHYVFTNKDLSADKKFLETHFSPELIKKMKEEYESATGMDNGLGIWIFRSYDNESLGIQQIGNISYEGDGVFKVNVEEGSTKTTKYITAKYVNDNVVIENVSDFN